ncbi:MAG TPA: hypothetical protein DEQ80_02235 [Anaerolinea thermolimosa]|uniref:Putative zinc-ribbon domain-containing protein n=1 Tax=Anaerolinea thermolimosa TaxID=229919 RepID=A0A3D1JGC7_9CHLR|nr:hypothetical protein [Anaerolinea thermolimosa]
MDIGTVFLVLALAVLVGLFISQPFFRSFKERIPSPDTARVDSVEHRRSALLAERDRLFSALQDLDFDFALGKIPEEDYPGQRAELLRHAAGVLRELDVLEGHQAETAVEERIEREVAARRADAASRKLRPAGQPVPEEDELEELIARRRAQRKDKAAGFCPKCGQVVQRSDTFCSNCGTRLHD